jgi:hypothetical protein
VPTAQGEETSEVLPLSANDGRTGNSDNSNAADCTSDDAQAVQEQPEQEEGAPSEDTVEAEDTDEGEDSLRAARVPLFCVCAFRRHDKEYNVIQAGCCGGDGVSVGILVVPADPNSDEKPVCTTCNSSCQRCVHLSAVRGEILPDVSAPADET